MNEAINIPSPAELITLTFIKPLLVLAITFLLARYARRESALHQYFVLATGMAVILLLPLVAWLLPTLALPLVPRDLWQAGFVPHIPEPWLLFTLLGLYLFGMLLVMVDLLGGIVRVYLVSYAADPITDGAWQEDLVRTQTEIGLNNKISLRMSHQIASPMMWGWLHPVVLLPASAQQWSASTRQHVLRHELAHIKRADWLLTVLARFACALFWYLPPTWKLAKHLSQATEKACDDHALLLGSRAEDYAETLMHMCLAHSQPSRHLQSPLLHMSQGSPISQRLHSILEQQQVRDNLLFWPRIQALFVGSLVLLSLGCAQATLLPRSYELPDDTRLIASSALLEALKTKSRQSEIVIANAGSGITIELPSTSNFQPQRIHSQPEPQRPEPAAVALPQAQPAAFSGKPVHAQSRQGLATAENEITGHSLQRESYQHTYPWRALERGLEGEVTLSYDVEADGSVSSAEIISSSHSLFSQHTLRAIKKTHFQPMMSAGQPVAVRNVVETFYYRISEQ